MSRRPITTFVRAEDVDEDENYLNTSQYIKKLEEENRHLRKKCREIDEMVTMSKEEYDNLASNVTEIKRLEKANKNLRAERNELHEMTGGRYRRPDKRDLEIFRLKNMEEALKNHISKLRQQRSKVAEENAKLKKQMSEMLKVIEEGPIPHIPVLTPQRVYGGKNKRRGRRAITPVYGMTDSDD